MTVLSVYCISDRKAQKAHQLTLHRCIIFNIYNFKNKEKYLIFIV